jgi:hypothetical protein
MISCEWSLEKKSLSCLLIMTIPADQVICFGEEPAQSVLERRWCWDELLSGTGALNPFTEPAALHLLSLLAWSLVASRLADLPGWPANNFKNKGIFISWSMLLIFLVAHIFLVVVFYSESSYIDMVHKSCWLLFTGSSLGLVFESLERKSPCPLQCASPAISYSCTHVLKEIKRFTRELECLKLINPSSEHDNLHKLLNPYL